jgi:23S rRNA G2069 N7-methylase RlmK/C1962 C5-methylase RlmI
MYFLDCESDNRLAKVIEGIPIFRILNEIGDEYKDTAIDHYLHDFVHMVYTTSSMNSDEENNVFWTNYFLQ